MGTCTWLGAEKTHGTGSVCNPAFAQWSPALHRIHVSHQLNRSLLTRGLTLLPACLATLFVASVMIEAFDDDLDLWPFGVEDFAAASYELPLTGGLPLWSRSALSDAYCFLMAAGPRLVLRHRARSALPTDSLSNSLCTMAEPGWRDLTASPELGHAVFGVQGDDEHTCARP
jgi:hypothetical protein